MSESFDPYHNWLGIPPEEQPPNHYALLGLKLFEDKANVIEAAANRQMLFVKQCGTGPHSDASQKLLNELSTARLALLNVEKKEAYDAKLKEEQQAADLPPLGTAPEIKINEAPTTQSSSSGKLPLIAGGAVAAVVIIGAVVFSLSGTDEADVVDTNRNSTEMVENSTNGPIDSQPEKSSDPPATDPPDTKSSTTNDNPPEPGTKVASTDTKPPVNPKPTTTDKKPPDANAGSPTSADKPSPTVAATGKTVDLLKLIDPKRDAVRGDFSLENGNLTWQRTGGSLLQIPINVPEEYDLVVTSSRTDGIGLAIGLLVGGHQTLAIIDHTTGSGLNLLDGKSWAKNETSNGERGLFQPGKESTVVCHVRKSSVKVTFDGKTLIDWKGDLARLSMEKSLAVPNKRALIIGGNAVHSISKLELRPVGSSGPETTLSQALADREPIPDSADQKEAIALIKDLFKDEYAAAKKPEQKYELAKTLLQQGIRTADDPVSKYVLLQEARDLAADAGMAETALSAVEEIARDYEVDLWEAREKALSESASHARFPPQNKALVEAAIQLVNEAIDDDRYALAVKLANIAVSAARKARDKNISSQVFKLRSQVTALRKDFDTAMKAAETLKEKPDDPAANFVWGSYLCFQKNDWPAGLPLLAKSNDTKLKQVIELDLKSPTESADQLKVADAWWDWIESSKKKENQRFRVAAHYWYKKAQPGVNGLTKLKIDKRLKEIGEVDQPRTATVATSGTSPLKPFTVIPSPPSSPAEIAALNRKAAEWVLGLGGTINTSAGSFRAIAELPKQPFQITQIVLSNKPITDDGLTNLRGLTSLIDLRLENAPIGDAGFAHLKGLTNLVTLLINGTRVSDTGLANLQGMTNLATIYLGGTPITGAGFEHFKGMTKLGQLRIASTQVNNDGLSHLQGMTSLAVLHLNNTQVSDAGIAHLKGLTNLSVLLINNTKVSDAGLVHIQGMTNLTGLYLGGTSINGTGLKHLKGMTKLTGLRLESTQINDAGLVHLKGLTSLIDLRIENTRVGDTGLRHLKGLTNLSTLLLSNTQVSDAGLVYIKGMIKIKTLYLRGTRVTPNGVAKLQQSLPKCRITR